MKRTHRLSGSCFEARYRKGVTLTEVLMSLLIMSIGVVSLVTLFPISTLRVIEATNMTNATVLRYCAEARIDAQPSIVFDPDSNPATNHLGQDYVVDPLGFVVFGKIGGTPTVFGTNPPASVTVPLPSRYPGSTSIASEDDARQLVASTDTFTEQGDGRILAGTYSSTSVTLDPNVDLSGLAGLNLATTEVRAILFDPFKDRSEIRRLTTITQPAPHTISWSPALPSSFTDVGRVMVATGDEYYTWMLTVHRQISGPANVEVAVFVKRLFTQAAEQVYSAKLVPIVPGTSKENNSVTVSFTGDKPAIRRGGYLFDTKNCRWYRISAITSTTATSVSVKLEDSIRKANTEDLNLDGVLNPKEDANNNGVLDSGEDLNGNGRLDGAEDSNGNGVLDEGGVIVFPNVVGVFPIETKVP